METLTEKTLRNGETFAFQTRNEDDLRIARLFFSSKLGRFVIWFNGALIHSSKTFKAFNTRLTKLTRDWDLVQTDYYED